MSESDRGLLLGDALFETVLVHRGVPFRLRRHLDRLREASRRTGIPVPADLEELIFEGRSDPAGSSSEPGPVEANPSGGPLPPGADSEFAALRITVTRGPGVGLAPPLEPSGRLHLDWRSIRRPSPTRRVPLSAVIAGRVDERSLTSGLKHTGYLERILAIRVAREAGARVIVSEVNEFRLKFARDLGLEAVNPMEIDVAELCREKSGGSGADIVFEVSGAKAAAAAVDMVKACTGAVLS